MKNAIIDIIDDIKSSELTQKGHNILATIALIITSILEVIFCGSFGPILQIIVFIAFSASICWWTLKTTYGRKFTNSLFEE